VKQPFDEARLAKSRDPVDAPNQDFDWEQLYQRLSEDAREGDNDKRLAEAVTRLLQMLVPPVQRGIRIEAMGLRLVALAWVLNPGYFAGAPSLLQMLVPPVQRGIRIEAMGLRLVALAWVLNPGYFTGAPSLRQLARRCGVTPAALARYTGQYSRLIRWRHRGQRHAWNWSQFERSPLTDGDASSVAQRRPNSASAG